MAIDKQIRANRRTGPKGGGPRTTATPRPGRDTLGRGLAAERIVLEGEDAAGFAGLRERLAFEFDPQSATEWFLVERLAGLVWRLARIPAFEAALFAWISHQQAEAHDAAGVSVGEVFFAGDRRALAPAEAGGAAARQRHRQRRVGRTLEALMAKADPLGKLARHECNLMRQLERTLQELGTRRRGGASWGRAHPNGAHKTPAAASN